MAAASREKLGIRTRERSLEFRGLVFWRRGAKYTTGPAYNETHASTGFCSPGSWGDAAGGGGSGADRHTAGYVFGRESGARQGGPADGRDHGTGSGPGEGTGATLERAVHNYSGAERPRSHRQSEN